jgi:hypothetical protein
MLKWDTAWRALRDAAGLPGLRFHDLRHTVITELAEMGVATTYLSPSAVICRAGCQGLVVLVLVGLLNRLRGSPCSTTCCSSSPDGLTAPISRASFSQ